MPTDVEIKWRPIKVWPPASDQKVNADLAGGWGPMLLPKTLGKLKAELGKMAILEAMIETDHEAAGYSRLDGAPMAAAVAKTQRVAVWFEVGGKMRAIRAGGFNTWLKNLHAIALTLERNRLIRAYGTLSVREQYGGLPALPAPGESTSAHRAPEPMEAKEAPSEAPSEAQLREAAQTILELAGRDRTSGAAVAQILTKPNARRDMYRTAAKLCHTDKHGGNEAPMMRLNSANSLLNRHDQERVNA